MNFKAALKIHRIKSFVKSKCNLTNVSEAGPPYLLNGSLLGRLVPSATFQEFKGDPQNRMNSFVKFHCNLTHVFEGGPHTKSRPIGMAMANRDISGI